MTERTDQYVLSRVERWHIHLRDWFVRAMVGPPDVCFVTRNSKRLGWQQGKTIYFNRTYLYIIPDEELEELIAHEVCHFWQYHLMPSSSHHGEFWHWLMREVCGFTHAEAKSSFYVGSDKRKAVSQLLKLQEVLNDLNESHPGIIEARGAAQSIRPDSPESE